MDPALKEREIRAFLALPLAPFFQSELTPLIEQLKREYPKVRWVNPSQVHITLHFFGSVRQEQVSEISRCVKLETVKTKPFEILLKGVGAFPNLERSRVIWVGVEGETAALVALRRSVEKNLEEAGFEIETREFKPHLTIGRVKEKSRPLERHSLVFGPTQGKQMNAVVLFQSHLTPQGPLYEAIETYSFSAP